MTSPSLFLTPSEFAIAAKISLATVRRRIDDGSIAVWQPGGRRTALRIPKSALLLTAPPAPPSNSETSSTPKTPSRPARPKPRWMR